MLLSLGTTTYGSWAAFSGLSVGSWKAVSGWKQQSVFSLHCEVRMPSQSISISAFQNTAPVLSQTATVADVSLSVWYLPLEIWLQLVTLASSSAAVGAPPPGVLGGGEVGGAPPVSTVIRSKSGAHPLSLENLIELVPSRSVTVTASVPTVFQVPVVAKVSRLAAAPFTLIWPVRVAPPLMYPMVTVAEPALPATPLNCRVPLLLPTKPTRLPPEQPLQLATLAPPASVLPDASASYEATAALAAASGTSTAAPNAAVMAAAIRSRFFRMVTSFNRQSSCLLSRDHTDVYNDRQYRRTLLLQCGTRRPQHVRRRVVEDSPQRQRGRRRGGPVGRALGHA